LRTDLAEDLAAIEADHGQVEQVLVNLAINARDAMSHGGTLTITTSPADLRDGDARLRSGASPGRYAELAVTDTGTGMSPQTVARIFEPFFTTKPPGHGTGLGLSTVYGIITGVGGSLHAESERRHRHHLPALLPRYQFPRRHVAGRSVARHLGARGNDPGRRR